VPTTSLQFIHAFQLPKTVKIIDIGGGDSKLADYLLEEGFTDITVLDISAQAIEKAKKRLGSNAAKIKWLVHDVTDFVPDNTYDVWHDRATFHFLTRHEQIANYVNKAAKAVKGYMIIGTFSDNGPEKCSGLPVQRYSESALTAELQKSFAKIRCITEDHITPFNTHQNFLFCSFKKQEGY
jgi:2-polyprenyl-3-methyl-5-hydroxy-6-metoxy-1,4-benzoquinol methylase